MKTLLILAFSICLVLSTKAQNDSSTSFIKYYDSVNLQLSGHHTSLTNPAGTGECNRPANTLLLGKRDTGLPHVPPDDELGTDGIMPPAEGDVNIFWIHGLNGSVESLRVPARATEFGSVDGTFPPRKAHSIIGLTAGDQTYLENLGIINAARDMKDVADNLQGSYTPTSKDFIIAHSQGGIVAREWLRDMDENPAQFQKYAHGLVTFGTPHAGAMILNKTRPELEDQTGPFFKEACGALGKAAVANQVRNKFLLKMILTQNMKDRLVGLSCDFFAETVVPFALDNYHKSTTVDYYVGSPFLTQPSGLHPTGLSNYVLKVPVVQFYGEEEQPVMWRYFSSNFDLGKDQALQSGNATQEFIYDQDDQLQGKVSILTNDFQASYASVETKYRAWKAARIGASALGLAGLSLAVVAKHYENLNKDFMNAYQGAIVWLANANDYYQTQLLGARAITSVKYCVMTESKRYIDRRTLPPTVTDSIKKIETVAGPGGCTTGFIYLRQYNVNSYTTCREEKLGTSYYRNEYYYKPNDGVVLAESASAKIKTNSGAAHMYEKMPRTNHDQMKNSSMTRDALTKLYNGNFGWFFKVDLR